MLVVNYLPRLPNIWLRSYSSFLNLKNNDIENLLQSQSIKIHNGRCCYKINCLCPEKSNHMMFINPKTGWFSCEKGLCHGDGDVLKKHFTDKNTPLYLDHGNVPNDYEKALPFSDLNFSTKNAIKTHFKLNCDFSDNIIQDYHIKYMENNIFFPYYHFGNKLASYKQMPLNDRGMVEKKLGLSGLFGWNNMNTTKKEIILTSSENLALSLSQHFYNNIKFSHLIICTLPDGFQNLSQEIIPLLEPFTKIMFWSDSSTDIRKAWDNVKSFSNKLNSERCFFFNNLSELNFEKNIKNMTDLSKYTIPLHSKSITNFHYMRQEILSQIQNHKKFQGVKWRRFPMLNNILKGHRRGELSILTGPTGSGKTTYLSEYSLDLCIQGVNTLWGSFEIPNTRLARLMLHQFANLNLEQNLKYFDQYADSFEQLPLYFMTHQGANNIKTIIESMSHAVYIHDISHIIIDNLQFMLGDESSVSSFDRFAKQDSVIASFRRFATAYNVHITLIIHPRKEINEELTNHSIFGGIKAIQEADNVMILQEKTTFPQMLKKKYIQVTKNRFDGDLGIMPLTFDRNKLSFSNIIV